jgi:hypothetical protein
MILTEETLLLQKRAGIITESQYNEKMAEMEEENLNEADADEAEMLSALKSVAGTIEKANDNVKPSPKDEEVNEGLLTLGAIVTGAPGLISTLGKGADLIGKAFGKDKTKIGTVLQKAGHALEETYLKSIGGWLQAAYPKKYVNQNPLDKGSALYDAAHKIYGAMLIGAAVASGYEAGKAAELMHKGVEGGLALLKGKEVLDIGQKIASA